MSDDSPVGLDDLKARMAEMDEPAPAPKKAPVKKSAKRGAPPEELVKATTNLAEQIASAQEEEAKRAAEEEDAEKPDHVDQFEYRYTRIDNPRVRRAIEKRCEPMSFDELVANNRLIQLVPIIPGKLEVSYQTLSGKESYWVDMTMQAVPPAVRETWAGFARLALAVTSVNGVVLPSVYSKDEGTVDDKRARKRVAALQDQPQPFQEMMLVNYYWFLDRTSLLYQEELLPLDDG